MYLVLWQQPESSSLETGDGIVYSHFSPLEGAISTREFISSILFPDNDISKAFDVTQLVAVEVDQQLSQARVGGGEVDLHLGVFPRTHAGIQPVNN